ncbi:MAG TPA: hypothetical protein VHK88_17535 [Aquihabitans sp.]|jgi:hypothetical protein|nr:hypothetical protein [Aquihabitans sp.]
MDPTEADGGSAAFDAALRALTDDERAGAAAAERRREHSLRRQAAESGAFAGVLLDLAERRQRLVIVTVGGRSVRGTIRTLGTDFVGLRSPGAETALVATRAVTSVRTEPGTAPTAGDRVVHLDASLAAVLADLAAERPWCSVHTTAGEAVGGELRGAGVDVIAVRAATGDTTYVPLHAVVDVVVP